MSSTTCSRSGSFESIPEVGFLQQMVNDDIANLNKSLVSEFKRMELEGKLLPEPLLAADKSRFVLFPIKHTDVSPITHIAHTASKLI
jgi:hypothetical protein